MYNNNSTKQRIADRAVGRWLSILPAVCPTLPTQALRNRPGPCPMCGGKDRFRFDDKGGNGTYYCNQCGAGSGVKLVMELNKITFAEAARLIERELPSSTINLPKVKKADFSMERVQALWSTGRPLDGKDPASRFLASRGLSFEACRSLKWAPRVTYVHEDKTKTEHPAMLALFVAPDRHSISVHQTFLDEHGRKANVPIIRKMVPVTMPSGGAVRLFPSAETLGIAEGIETALSAAKIHDVPVWACLSAGHLQKWTPPENVRHVIVFADNDKSMTGQMSAYSLAYQLIKNGLTADVRIAPPDIGGPKGSDWNDVLMCEAS